MAIKKKVLIPYSFLPPPLLDKLAKSFPVFGKASLGFFPELKLQLKQAEIDIEARDYLTKCIFSAIIFFVFFGLFCAIVISKFNPSGAFLFGYSVALFLTFFIFMQQLMYPKIHASKKVRGIERNLLPALQNMLIQLNAGVPLFNILVNISKSNYGEVSSEFTKIVKEVSTGTAQIKALEESAVMNPSIFYRRSIWQMVNGMKAGSEIAQVIEESIHSLSDEQILEIQKYGSQLNPLAMFYMLVAVIMPALGMTFLIIISSFVSLSEEGTKIVFWSLLGFVVFFQIMFMGIIRSKRPNLIGD